MSRAKYYAAAFAFMLLNAAKMLYPQTPQSLRQTLSDSVESRVDYAAVVAAIGKDICSDGVIEAINLGLSGKTETVSVIAEDSAQDSIPDVSDDSAEEPQTQPEPEESEQVYEPLAPEETPLPEAVSAFLERQAEFEGCAIPDNVDADMPKLPFSYASPVSGANSSGFGYRVHPIHNTVKFHYGTDFAADSGESVLSFADGVAVAAGVNDSYGNYLIIDHGNGYSSLYAHLSDFAIREGEEVKKGQLVGFVGSTGLATGPHLHFELHYGDKYLNPEYYL